MIVCLSLELLKKQTNLCFLFPQVFDIAKCKSSKAPRRSDQAETVLHNGKRAKFT